MFIQLIQRMKIPNIPFPPLMTILKQDGQDKLVAKKNDYIRIAPRTSISPC